MRITLAMRRWNEVVERVDRVLGDDRIEWVEMVRRLLARGERLLAVELTSCWLGIVGPAWQLRHSCSSERDRGAAPARMGDEAI